MHAISVSSNQVCGNFLAVHDDRIETYESVFLKLFDIVFAESLPRFTGLVVAHGTAIEREAFAPVHPLPIFWKTTLVQEQVGVNWTEECLLRAFIVWQLMFSRFVFGDYRFPLIAEFVFDSRLRFYEKCG